MGTQQFVPKRVGLFNPHSYASIKNKAHFRNTSEQHVHNSIVDLPEHFELVMSKS